MTNIIDTKITARTSEEYYENPPEDPNRSVLHVDILIDISMLGPGWNIGL
jgi:hypothetical protein